MITYLDKYLNIILKAHQKLTLFFKIKTDDSF